VASIIAERVAVGPTTAVVSAFAGVTDELVEAAGWAALGDPRYGEITAVAQAVDVLLDRLNELLIGISLVKECTPRTRDSVLSTGERLSSILVAGALRSRGTEAAPCDAAGLIVTDANFGKAWVDMGASRLRVREHFEQAGPLQVVTGFVAGTAEGETTTLGRGGSDYTATLLGAMLDAEAVEIWTDVDGVMSADPRIVREAFSLDGMSYDELMELSHWGARVMHPSAVQPAREAGMPILIRNTLNPEFPGTEVRADYPRAPGYPVRGIASINDVALLRLEGTGLQGAPGIAERLFGALARERISVILITQASSERSICFAVEPGDHTRAVDVIHGEFALERQAGQVDDLIVEEHCSVLAAVGEAMRETPGIVGRIFNVLGHHRVNVRAIAQGSSELNVSLVVEQEDEERALRAIHRTLFRPPGRSVHLYVAGVGRVGSALLAQVEAQAPELHQAGVELLLVGLARSTVATIDPSGLDLREWRATLEAGRYSGPEMVEALLESDHPSRIFVDTTASTEVVGSYESLLRDGVAVISANKLAFAGPMEQFETLRTLGSRGMGIFYETTVGAGLPVLRTIQDLVSTGDTIQKIEGVLSGTLSFICDRLMAGASFSSALADELGLTEPDPREDLGGRDVARKLVILGRIAGFSIEMADVDVKPLLLDEPWVSGSLEDFWDRLPEVDEGFVERRQAAEASGTKLTYLASVEDGQATVQMVALPSTHPCGGLSASENQVAVTSRRYSETRLVIQGPGAGPEVTAAGVFADVLRALAESSWTDRI
jgi:aspartokinase/homoserine dehydrogenase 1